MLPASSPNLDGLLLDIATAIELSPRDRQVAESRYQKLKEHLERPQSPFAPYLAKSDSRIYPQGSISIGTTVVSGTEEDRFDLDALVEVNLPAGWTPKQTLDLLFQALKDFPGAEKVVRCTRCVQIQFAFMHMDVTVMDPQQAPRVERAGEIFHSPDKGEDKRVPANPFGFSQYFRQNVAAGDKNFLTLMAQRRGKYAIDRLIAQNGEYGAAQQDNLPHVIPPHLDSEQVVAHKLMKRYVYLKYESRDRKKPPTIFLAKLVPDAGPAVGGLCAQLIKQAQFIDDMMRAHLTAGTMPDERNPSYHPDRLNDRWPKDQKDMLVLADDMRGLVGALHRARESDFNQIAKIMSDLFGERVSKRTVEKMLGHAADPAVQQEAQYEKKSGTIILPGTVATPAVIGSLSAVPRHNFHSEVLKKKK